MERKQFIKTLSFLAFSGPMTWAACKKDGSNTSTDEAGTDVSVDESCVVTPAETEGPFPTKTPTSYVRSDIRKGDGIGVDMTTLITITNVKDNCTPLSGVLVDIWHCDVDGNYSQYGGMQMQSTNYQSVNWFRGRQVTDSNGLVNFKTIFPGWYQSRATHIHVHIYDASGKSLLVTQIAFQDSLSVDVNTNGSKYGYTKGISGYTYNNRDNVFGDGVDKEMSTVTGTMAEGFEMKITLKVNA
ncbi:intradiol ring-cleavage dioxygenase [Sphingobacterium alkalisoli]|uniref:Intradiol ring-cleavage dioxygenase n=1 Tax=Sphingobacterium alkalisoli TaxID=1874115 RepID=A0A4U0H2C5_9SPHI|nr:intradiol ring-cleavage dioxygenase [Sphingobacterium alkalisoli]TJY65781.1 intradiol ring-cleavage dioxygenase [Sphingobacterium alkalisoli]GGH18351.1 3,4-dioxygenase subunit beta [Sphingobacterium alkalisoli]